MATSPWGLILEDLAETIEVIAPTFDAEQTFRRMPRARAAEQGLRDRQFRLVRWSQVGEVMIFGAGEDQLGRDQLVEVEYTESDDLDDRVHSDERDLVTALDSESGYPSGTGWALRVRRLVRGQTSMSDPENGRVVVQFVVRLIWRESVSHAS